VLASLGANLPMSTVIGWLRHDDPAVPGDACRRARNPAAAIALGRMRQAEGRGLLLSMIKATPTAEVVEALVGGADHTVFRLGRVAREWPELATASAETLDGIDKPMEPTGWLRNYSGGEDRYRRLSYRRAGDVRPEGLNYGKTMAYR